jgi:hypothetical protein
MASYIPVLAILRSNFVRLHKRKIEEAKVNSRTACILNALLGMHRQTHSFLKFLSDIEAKY